MRCYLLKRLEKAKNRQKVTIWVQTILLFLITPLFFSQALAQNCTSENARLGRCGEPTLEERETIQTLITEIPCSSQREALNKLFLSHAIKLVTDLDENVYAQFIEKSSYPYLKSNFILFNRDFWKNQPNYGDVNSHSRMLRHEIGHALYPPGITVKNYKGKNYGLFGEDFAKLGEASCYEKEAIDAYIEHCWIEGKLGDICDVTWEFIQN